MGQQNPNLLQFEVQGEVRTFEKKTPIAGVVITSDKGTYARSNGLGEFRIKVGLGDVLFFEGQGIDPVQYTVINNEQIILEVKNNEPKTNGKQDADWDIVHQQLLDSALYYKTRNLEKSIRYVSESMKRSNAITKIQLSRSLTTLGEIYLYHKQYDLAASHLEDAMAAKKTIKGTLLLAKVLMTLGDYKGGQKILKPLEQHKEILVEQSVELYQLLGETYAGLKAYQNAIPYYIKALKIAEKGNIPTQVIELYSIIGEAYAAQNKNVEAKTYFEKAISLSKTQTPEESVAESEKVADFYNKTSQYDEEILLRKRNLNQLSRLPLGMAIKSRNEGLDTISTQIINYKIGRAYVSQNKLDQAIPYLRRSIVEADQRKDLEIQKEATRKLSEVYEYQGDFSKAYQTYRDYVTLVDTLYIKKEQEISLLTRLNREIVRNKNRIFTLEQEREFSQSKYNLAVSQQNLITEKSKRQQWLIYSLILVLSLLTITAFFYYRSNGKQKLANNLLALKSLRTQMNPHFIFNALNSVNHYIAQNDERSANRFLSEFSMLMRNVLENSEQDYIPLNKELELLELYLKLEHARFPDKFEYTIKLDQGVNVDAFEIPPMMLQPYVENAIWHGLRYKEKKGRLDIQIHQEKDQLIVTIEDNGIGRKRSASLKTQHQRKQKSKAMGNIAKRIEILNEIHKNKIAVNVTDLNAEGIGTRVVLKLKAKK